MAEHQYQFIFGGEKRLYRIYFHIKNDQISSKCDCNSNKARNGYCWHREYIIAGKTSRLIGGDTEKQKEFIQTVLHTSDGDRLIQKSKKKFDGETNCRRCSSSRIVKLNSSIVARINTIFRETKHHTYYCRECKWTW